MILGIFWMVTAHAAVLLSSHEILLRVKTGKSCQDAVLFLVIRLALVTGIVILSGLIGALRGSWLGAAGFLGLLILVCTGAHRRLPWAAIGGLDRRALIVGVVLGVRILIQAWYFAPFAGDTLTYHLPKVAEWVSQGGFTRDLGADPRVTFPAGFEAIEVWWVVFLHHDVVIEGAGIEFLALAAVSTGALARGLGLGTRAAFLASMLVAVTPGLHFQALGCINDGPSAALFIASAALVVGRAPVSLVLLIAGLGIGIKATYLYAFPGIILLHVFESRRKGLPNHSARAERLLGVLGLALGGFWYLRNTLDYGNPVYPMGTPAAIFPSGHPIQQMGPSLHSFVVNASNLVNISVYDHAAPYGVMMKGISGWGAAGFACGLPALFLAVRSEPGIRRLAAAFGLSLGCIMALVQTDLWFTRFLLFMPALLAVAVAWLSEKLPALSTFATMVMILQFAATCFSPEEFPIGHLGELAHRSWRDRSRGPIVPSEPADDAIACLVPGGNWSYLLYRPDYSRKLIYIRETTGSGIVNAMRRKNVRILYATAAYPPVKEAVQNGDLEILVGAFLRLRN